MTPAAAAFSMLIGTWHCSGTFLKPGKAIASTESFALGLDETSLLKQHVDEAPWTFKDVEIWSTDAGGTQQKFVYEISSGSYQGTSRH